jgi:hypothetical protein
MILHKDTIISTDVIKQEFICNIEACKGACCIEGDFGAPLEEDELAIIGANLKGILPHLDKESVVQIETSGFYEKDTDGDWVTQCRPSGACVFSTQDKNGVLGCGIEQAWKAGDSDFRKPISCHLYPIRISKVGDYTALNYHRWDICSPACALGNKHGLKLHVFLKDALVRKFGIQWYNELCNIAESFDSAE